MSDLMNKALKCFVDTVSKPKLALIIILFGILAIFSQFLALLVGLYFIIQGVLLLTGYLELRRK